MYEILPEIWKLMNRLMKQEKVLTVLTVSNFIEFDLFRVDSIMFQNEILEQMKENFTKF